MKLNVWVVDYSVIDGATGGFRWNLYPDKLLEDLAGYTSCGIQVNWIGQVEVDLRNPDSVEEQIEEYMQLAGI